MQPQRPHVLTIAGFDPSSGAGLSADIKTFEQLKVYGLAICSGYTVQTEDKFYSVEWRKLDEVEKELEIILNKYKPKSVKFGIIPNLNWLEALCSIIKKHSTQTFIVVDPIWKSSTGFEFADFSDKKLNDILKNIDLLTPNLNELKHMSNNTDLNKYVSEISKKVNLLLKGGHNQINVGKDVLYESGKITEFEPTEIISYSKHGSGCVLSAAIAANMAFGFSCLESCKKAKIYIEKFLNSSSTLLGYHA